MLNDYATLALDVWVSKTHRTRRRRRSACQVRGRVPGSGNTTRSRTSRCGGCRRPGLARWHGSRHPYGRAAKWCGSRVTWLARAAEIRRRRVHRRASWRRRYQQFRIAGVDRSPDNVGVTVPDPARAGRGGGTRSVHRRRLRFPTPVSRRVPYRYGTRHRHWGSASPTL
jgi:hypothetical protein